MYEQPFNPFAANLAVVKGYFKSGKVLTMGILYLVSAVLSIVVSIITASNLDAYINSYLGILNRLGMDTSALSDAIYEALGSTASQNIGSTVYSAIFSSAIVILTAAAFLIIYFKSRSESPESSPKAGVTILHTLSVIAFVFAVIGLVFAILFIILGVVLTAILSSEMNSESIDLGNGYTMNLSASIIGGFIIGIGVVLLLVMIYTLLSTLFRKRYYRSIKDSITTVELQNRGAKGFGVISVINAVFTGLSLLSSISSIASLSAFGVSGVAVFNLILSLMSSVVTLLISIFDASIALGYKKYIDNMKYGYNGTPYNGIPAAGYAPADNGANPYAAPRQPYQNNYAAPQQPAAPTYNDSFNGYATSGSAAPSNCPVCGAPVDSAAPFCGNCGAKL